MPSFRAIPSIEQVLQRDAVRRAIDRHGRDVVTGAARRAAEELRIAMASPDQAAGSTTNPIDWIEARTVALAAAFAQPSLRRVINATGVVVHTNLGRAPIARAALEHARLAGGYSNLEYDLERGERGHRHAHAERLLCAVTGAESALVVNNTAAAALLTLAALASGREVIVSRGELVEIGGGFRVPDVLAQSGASLREVGTTNRTRVADYGAAINDRTAVILRVHPSNFRIEGFTERPSLPDLVAVARSFGIPLVEDLGSGWLGSAEDAGVLADEPTVRASLEAGADLVLFSGDKLLGGPQAGIIAGRRDLIDRLKAHPLMRAVRVDKLTYAVLEATLALWAEAPARMQVPVYRMLTMSAEELAARATHIASGIGAIAGAHAAIVAGWSTTGGGSAPGSKLPTQLVGVSVDGLTPDALDEALRRGDTPVVARVQDGVLVLDVRTIDESEIDDVIRAVASVVR